MAQIIKHKSYAVGRVLLHNNRLDNDGVTHSNENIDRSRTMYNYFLKKGTAEDIRKRLSEVFVAKNVKKRSNLITMAEAIVTLPKDVKKNDERAFFEGIYAFYQKDFGDENIINAVVHKDEITPHIHLDFVPITKTEPQILSPDVVKWKLEHNGEIERLCCKDIINRNYLRQMHKRLSEFMDEWLGYHTGIINGATANGNKTITELKLEELKKELQQLEMQKRQLQENLSLLQRYAENNHINMSELNLMGVVEKLRRQNEVYHDIIVRNDCVLTSTDLDKLECADIVITNTLPDSFEKHNKDAVHLYEENRKDRIR